jgi:outer membrane protein assembly factor BamA
MAVAIHLLCWGSVALSHTQSATASVSATACSISAPKRVNHDSDKASRTESKPAISGSEQRDPVRIEFYGLSAFSYCEALQFLRGDGVGFNEMPNSKATERAASIIKERLQSLGYVRARVDPVRDEETSRVLFVVNEGQRLALSDVRFEGNRAFTTEELSQHYSTCLARHQKTSTNEYDGEVHSYCDHVLMNLMRSRGYLEAKVEPENEIIDRGIVLKLKIDEGVLYRIGHIRITGNEALSLPQVRAKLELREGDIADGDKIGNWLFGDLKTLYGELGFIQYTGEIIPTFNRESRIVDLAVEIEEGERFTLRSLEFSGYVSKAINPHDLFVIREGDVFNQSLFEESIKRLNDSGVFEFIDKDRDVEFLKNNEESTLKVVVKLRNKPS